MAFHLNFLILDNLVSEYANAILLLGCDNVVVIPVSSDFGLHPGQVLLVVFLLKFGPAEIHSWVLFLELLQVEFLTHLV